MRCARNPISTRCFWNSGKCRTWGTRLTLFSRSSSVWKDRNRPMNPETAVRRVTIAEAGKHTGESVEIAGWLYNLRRSGKICFPQVRDGTGILQCVAVKSALPEETFEALKNLTQESSLIVRGKLRAGAGAPGGSEVDG